MRGWWSNGRGLKGLVIFFWFCVAGFGIAMASAPSEELPELPKAVATVAGFFLLILSQHLEFFHVAIRYDAEGLRLASPWRRRRFVPWSAIKGARYSRMLQRYVLSTARRGSIRLPVHLAGLDALREELAARGIALPVVR